jgi:putative oxidoreductase
MAIVMSPLGAARRLYSSSARLIDFLQSPLAFAIRLYVAWQFFASGLTKINDWSVTVALFESEYHVPVLSPAVAAALGTFAELTLPVLLVLGLGSRFVALALFAVNLVAVVSYPDLSAAGLKDHILWGTLLVVTFVYGPGRLSLDYFLGRGSGKPSERA